MIKEFNNQKEINKYYDKKTNTYIFKENKEYINLVVFNFSLDIEDCNIEAHSIRARDIRAYDIKAFDIKAWNIEAENIDADDIRALNIDALDINALDINASDIDARNIEARNIEARNISYYAVCFAYENIKCKSIKATRENHKLFVLDGKLEVEKNDCIIDTTLISKEYSEK